MTSRESGTLGTYHRYKIGQAQFQKWLKQTSEKLRLGGSVKPPTGPTSLNDRVPKKITDQPKKEHYAKGDSRAASSLHWSQLEPMTKTILDNLDAGQIPESVISILRDVIQLRKRSARFFSVAAAKSDNGTLKENYSAHIHIIEILERILHQFDAALSKVRPAAPMAPASGNDQLGMKDINNMFEYLKVEELRREDDEELDDGLASGATVPKSTKKPKKNGKKPKKQQKNQHVQRRTTSSQETSWIDTFQWLDEAEEEGQDEDFDYYMLIYCFFQDFNSIRTFVGDRWTEYFYHKSVSLDTLAVLTNAAYEIFHEMESELKRTLRNEPRLAEYEFMLETLFYDYGLEHVDYSDEDKLTDKERNYKIFGEADWLAFPAYSHIERLLEFIPPGKVPMIPASAIKHPKYGMHEFEGFLQFTRDVIDEIVPECCLIKAMKTNGLLPMIASAQDELTLDLEDIFRIRGYFSATIFGQALYVDIRYILENQVEEAFRLLETTGQRMRTTLEDQLPSIKGPWDLKKECRDRLAEVESFILKDFLEDDKERRLSEKDIREPFEKHYLLKRDPVWSGLLDFRCRLVLNNLGSRFISETPVVFGTAFIYVASRLGNTPGLHWPQMDRYLKLHGEDKVLQGAVSPEMTAVDLLKRFADCGISADDASSINSPSKSLEAFYQRYAREHGYFRHSMAYLNDIIQDKFDVEGADQFLKRGLIVPAEINSRGDSKKTAAEDTSPNLAVHSAMVSPIHLLEILEETMTSILEEKLSIDYFLLHGESLQLLQDLLEEFSSEVVKDIPSFTDSNIRTSKPTLLLTIVFKFMIEGDTAETTKRMGKVMTRFCSNLVV